MVMTLWFTNDDELVGMIADCFRTIPVVDSESEWCIAEALYARMLGLDQEE